MAEKLDPKPFEYPYPQKRPLTLQEQIARVLKTENLKAMQDQEIETYEEANDFEVEDSFHQEEPGSRYELLENEYPVMDEESVDQIPLPEGTPPGDSEPEPVASEPQIPSIDANGTDVAI